MSILVLPGDGIGKGVTAQAVKVMRAVSANGGPQFDMAEGAIGGGALASHGDPLPEAMLAAARKAKAIAGKDLANPLASILSVAMMLRHSLGLEDAARLVERAARRVLAEGYRTGDIMEPGATRVGTEAISDAVAAAVTALKA